MITTGGIPLKHTYSITHPELFIITDGNHTWYGADQEWYPSKWQRNAGCGATTASHLLSYLAEVQSNWVSLYPAHSQDRAEYLSFMNILWNYVTPGRMGVNTLHKFTTGISNYATTKGIELSFCELNIPPMKVARPTEEQCATFLRSAMVADRPVAFLNLSSGDVKGLDSWHWVTIIAMEEALDSILCTALDSSGQKLTVDFHLWLQTSKLGGGLVYISAE